MDKKQKNDTSESGFTGQAIGSKFVEKTVSFIKLKRSILCIVITCMCSITNQLLM